MSKKKSSSASSLLSSSVQQRVCTAKAMHLSVGGTCGGVSFTACRLVVGFFLLFPFDFWNFPPDALSNKSFALRYTFFPSSWHIDCLWFIDGYETAIKKVRNNYFGNDMKLCNYFL